jgi:hypothetical protein
MFQFVYGASLCFVCARLYLFVCFGSFVTLLTSFPLYVKVTHFECGAKNQCVDFASVGEGVSRLGLFYTCRYVVMFLMDFNSVSSSFLVTGYV